MNDAAATDDKTGVEASNSHERVNMDIDDGLANGTEEDDESFNLEDIPSDDISISTNDEDLEYDHDEAEYDAFNDVVMKPKGYILNVEQATLGEESMALLLWGKTDSFSDWTIKVVAETEDFGDDNTAVYSVHRFFLATGPKKSGYFEALFKESSERMNTVRLSKELAAHFPQFLNYMYSHPLESKALVNFDNWKSMAYFADHFLVSRLTEDVMRFIETDMYNLDHMENYLSDSEFDGATGDFASRFLQKASHVCAEMILSIQVDSSLLRSIPKTMFWHIMSTLMYSDSFRSSSDEDRDHVHGLMIGYLKHIDDEHYFHVLMSVVEFRFFDFDDSNFAVSRVLQWLELVHQKGWYVKDWLDIVWTYFLRKYLHLHLKEPNNDVGLSVLSMREVPTYIADGLFSELLLRRRTLELPQEPRTLRFNITLINGRDEGDRLRLREELELPTVKLTELVWN